MKIDRWKDADWISTHYKNSQWNERVNVIYPYILIAAGVNCGGGFVVRGASTNTTSANSVRSGKGGQKCWSVDHLPL